MAGFIKIFRQLEDWEWYMDSNTKSLFIHCLLQANHKDNKWRGKLVTKGSFITSSLKLSAQTGLSRQEVRTSLNRLKSTNEITIESTKQFTLISIVKWADYQGYDSRSNQQNNQDNNKRATIEQPSVNHQLTTNNNDKNINNENNKELPISKTSDSQKICQEYGANSLLELFEKEFKRPLSNIEIQKINDWEDKVGIENVIEGLRECSIYQKSNINYLDKVLISWLDSNKISKQNEEVEWSPYE